MSDSDDIVEIQVDVEHLLDIGKTQQAREYLERAFALAPDDPHTLALAARTALAEGELDEAEEYAHASLAVAPHGSNAQLVLFQVLHTRRSFGEAEAVILNMIREQPENAVLYGILASLMTETLNLTRARELTDHALRLDPEEHFARRQDLVLAIIDGEASADDPRLQKLVAEDPEAEDVMRTVMVALVNDHRYGEALQVAQVIFALNPGDEDLVDAIIELRALSHWSTIPLRPLMRSGWVGAGLLWGGAVVILTVGRRVLPVVVLAAFTLLWLAFVIYSWAWLPLLRSWFRRRGV